MTDEMEWNDLDIVIDDSEIKDSGNNKTEFTVLPKGEYPFTVTKVEYRNYQPKPGKTTGITKPCKQIVLGLVVDGGDKGTAWVDENLYFYPTCMFKVLSVFKAVGLISDGYKGSLPWDQLKGTKGRAKFDVEKYHSTKYDEDRERMIAKAFVKAAPNNNAESDSDWTDMPF